MDLRASASQRSSEHRVPIAAIAVIGFGSLVALAVGVVLYVGISSATTNTRQLLQDQGEALVDVIEQRISARLSPALAQSTWIAQALESGAVDLADRRQLDAFMFGALAGTPQIAGIAFVDTAGRSRRWGREKRDVVDADWSQRPEIPEWLADGAKQASSSWRTPFWTDTLDTTIVLHDTPLHRNGEFIGMLAQVIPIAELSAAMRQVQDRTGMVPFILYNHDRVLAHPWLSAWQPEQTAAEIQLPKLEGFGDLALERIWTPDNPRLFLLRDIQRTAASGTDIDGAYHVYLHRDINRYGPDPWTIGAYFNTAIQGGDETKRLVVALSVGGAVLIVSVIIAAYAGKRVSGPIEKLSAAARSVEEAGLDHAPAVPGSRIRELDDAARSFNRMVSGLRDRELIRRTLGRFVPEKVAQSLLSDGGQLEVLQTEATVLFCDLEGFTALTESVGPAGIMALLNEYFEAMVAILERHNGVVTQFQGDAILATFNVPIPDPQHAANALRASLEMQRAVSEGRFAGERVANRIGVSTGPLVAGAVGAQGRLSYTVHGDAVNLAARLEALNKDFNTRILVSEHTASMVEGFDLRPVSETTARGQSRPIVLFELQGEGVGIRVRS